MDASIVAMDNLIFECVSGSYSYGLATTTSDQDIRGVFIPPPQSDIGLSSVQQYRPSEGDTHYMSLREYTNHIANGAVNWMELLYVPNQVVIKSTPYWRALWENRDIFVTKKMARKALGFISNMHKRSLGNRVKPDLALVEVLANSATWEAVRELLEVEGVPHPVIGQGLEGIKSAYSQHIKRGMTKVISPEREAETQAIARKQSMHAVRMGRMVLSMVQTGSLQVDRSFERESLLAIKHGERDTDDALAEAAELVAQIETVLSTSVISDHVNIAVVNELLARIYTGYWRDNDWI